jgi:hypothetical protein
MEAQQRRMLIKQEIARLALGRDAVAHPASLYVYRRS